MAKGYEVMEMLCPTGGWVLVGDTFDGITWVDDRPRCTEAEFDAGFAEYDAWKSEQDAAAVTAKAAAEAKLAALGLDEEEVAAIVGGI